jgi:hypothetical protein
MSVFSNIRINVNHGQRRATITWETELTGEVIVAYSVWGVLGSWRALPNPVAASNGTYTDNALQVDSGLTVGYYRLCLVEPDDTEHMSEIVGIIGDLTPREYGIARRIMSEEFRTMRARDGYPVWHCIPRDFGVRPPNYDATSNTYVGPTCADAEDFGMGFVGGFYTPTLTWIRPFAVKKGPVTTTEDGVKETVDINARLLAFPRPAPGHMLIDPATDRRFLVGTDVESFRFRDVIAVAYEASLSYLSPSDIRYKFQPPALDTKAYRNLPYWTP